MIYDCFTFFNELDLLEIRLNILNDYVDKFVLVEATRNFANQEKPLYYQENKERFKKFEDKIIHIVLDEYPLEDKITGWTIETLQRNFIAKGIESCQDDDIILISDLDEIPRPELIKQNYNPKKIVAFDCDVYNFFLNNYTIGFNWTHGTKMVSYKNFKSILNDYDFSKTYAIDQQFAIGTTASGIRLYYGKMQTHLKKAGWHFSYIGNIETVMNKVNATPECSHILSKEDYIKKIHSKKFIDTFYMVPVYINETFPKYIQENVDKYADLIINENCKNLNFWNGTIKYGIKYFLDNIFAIKKDNRNGIIRTNLIILGIKIRLKKEHINKKEMPV